jgi:hypothetical protein
MVRTGSKRAFVACALLIIGAGCRPIDNQTPSQPVTFGNAAPIGTWQNTAGAPAAGTSGATPQGQPTAGVGGGGAAGSAIGSGMAAMVSPIGAMNTGGAPGSGGAAAVGTGGTFGSGGMTGTDMNMNMNMNNMGMNSMSTGTGGSGAGNGGSTTALALTFDVTTVSQGGRYAPRNVGAIWIETGGGQFVKTLEVWAGTRGRYLSRFNGEAGGNRVDAVTSATLRQYGAHHSTWNLTDVNGKPIANGDYKVVIEVTDHDGPGQSADAPFTYAGMATMQMPADQQFYTGMHIVVQ